MVTGRNYKNEAIQVTVDEGSGPIIHIIGTDDILEVFKQDCIIKITLPESVDPEDINPKAPATKQEVCSDIGAADFVVARTLIQTEELIKGLHLQNRIDKNKLLDAMRVCRDHLIAAYNIAFHLSLDIYEATNSYIENGSSQDRVKKIPQINDLTTKSHNFLSSIKLTLQDFVNVLNTIFKTDLKGPKYHIIKKHFGDQLGKDHNLYKVLNDYEPYIHMLVNWRNSIEHPKSDNKFIVRNFEMKANGLVFPNWHHYPHGNIINITSEIPSILQLVVEFIEITTAISLLEKVEGPLVYHLQFISEEEQNPMCPMHIKTQYIPPEYMHNITTR
ncbi:hypothetical protein [Maridesulfovibrio sp.]|uniref:hypothetical protein n=1 Tax=Maridesulfovibrio sp. TaxID=2795000 RepID=UPI0039EF638A